MPGTRGPDFRVGAGTRWDRVAAVREPHGSGFPVGASIRTVSRPMGPVDSNPLLVLATVLIAGVSLGLGARRIGLPSITGQIVAGVLIGHAGLGLLDHEAAHSLQPLTNFALGLMAVTIGGHLNMARLRNAGKRLSYLLVAEAVVTPAIVFAVLAFIPGVTWSMALLFGTLAVSTAPATIVALVKESRAKGIFVKTLIAAVAFNNVACILLFELARATARVDLGVSDYTLAEILFEPTVQLVEGLAIGGAGAFAMEGLSRFIKRTEERATAAFVILLLTSGTASWFDVSPLLACLCLGFIQSNFTKARDGLLDTVFDDFQPAILAIFFTLAGLELSFDHIGEVGLIAAALFAARFVGKLASANLAMRLAGATDRVRQNLGIALVPQAGVAVGLVLLLQEDPQFRESAGETVTMFVGVVLTVVTANEIVGPLLTRFALGRSGEVGKDRMRLIDFLHEESIVTDLEPASKEDAIERLTDLLVSSHHLADVNRDELLRSVLERESQVSTCLGGGLAVPHGILPTGRGMVGVMALSREGWPFDTPDGKPVHCMVLLATPDDERDRHLQVLAALARTLGKDPKMQAQLFAAKSPAHAYEILHDEEAEGFNYFLED